MGKPRYHTTNIDDYDDDEEDSAKITALKFDQITYLFGDIGLWQATWAIILSMFQLVCTFHIFSFVFQSMSRDFWCARPDGMPNMTVSSWTNLSQPQGACSILDFKFSDMLESNYNDYLQLATSSDASNMTKCNNFEFSTDDYGMTIVEEYNLVCERKNLLSVVEMCFLAGAAVGSVCSGWISDRFGRKHTLMGFALVQTTLGTLLAFSTSLAMFMTLRVIIGFASMTVAVVSFVLVVELVSGKWRTIIGILNILPVAISYILTSGIAYLTRDWRLMQLVISVPWIALLFIWYCVPESPRWLLARGRLDELVELIERAARMNGRTLPSNYRKSLEANLKETTAPCLPSGGGIGPLSSPTSSPSSPPASMMGGAKQSEADACHPVNGTAARTPAVPELRADISNKSPLVVVFNKDYWRTTVLTLIVWLTLIIIYFGLTLHLSNLGGNVYLNTAIAGLIEAISICASIVVVLKLGIRQNLIAYMLIAGVCCLAANLVPGGNLFGVIGLAMIAKCAIGANNAIIPTFTAQQYPTVVRNFGLGMGNLAAGVALILVPYMWLLEHVSPLLPLTIMGVCGIVGAGALMMMKDVSRDID
ncbi:solute carrier family 22 member 4 isoform X2 [Episyrphus balteatus]|uniref:solute carrier family 22 member 4 isoform X2 n=1 Tax=Episyrphus balteatus TaxID=286459 RepID=UPI002486616F|nr:solute carrier family 22 member 4 isoform X2 [Episyrphus balteatus]